MASELEFLKSMQQNKEIEWKQISLIGLFRSGTNYTRTLLELNYNVVINYNLWGWKHGLMPTFSDGSKINYDNDNILLIIKDPYSTLDSWFSYLLENGKNLRGSKESFGSFLRSPIYFFDEGNNSAPEYYFSNPIQMWISVVWNHVSFVEKMNGYIIQYESLLHNPEETLNKIANKFNLKKKVNEFILPKKITHNMPDKKKRTNETDYLTGENFAKKDYFLNKEYLKKFTEEDLIFFEKELNKEIWKKINKIIDTYNIKFSFSQEKTLYYSSFFLENSISDKQLFEKFMENIKTRASTIIRLGDGEAKILAYPKYINRQILNKQLSIWFGNKEFSEEEILDIKENLIDSIRNSDFLGLPTNKRLLGSSDEKLTMDQKMCILLYHTLINDYNIDLSQKTIGSASIHMWLNQSGEINKIINDKSKILFIARTEKCAENLVLHKIITHYSFIPVPGESWSRESNISDHYPERYKELIDTIKNTKERFDIAVVGAGPLGKIYANELRKIGISTIDIGSLVDIWAKEIPKERKLLNNKLWFKTGKGS